MARNAGAVEVSTETTEFTAAMLAGRFAPSRRWCPGQARIWVGEVWIHQLDDAELDRRQPVAQSGPEVLVLQRHDHRGQTVLRFTTADVALT